MANFINPYHIFTFKINMVLVSIVQMFNRNTLLSDDYIKINITRFIDRGA